ncbi:MAG: high frequency lysogenization protein HflD [Chromatiales bacterium]|nr:high frequency lysogenization protein HflD [Chromatiales bacterium]
MSHSIEDRTLALAGVAQACSLVNQIAFRGITDSQAMEASLSSLFRFDAEDVPSVYGSVSGMMVGLRLLREFLRGGPEAARENQQVGRYAFTLLQLERTLASAPAPMERIGRSLRAIGENLEDSTVLDGKTLEAIANAYSENISPLNPRVMVNGEPNHLQNAGNVNRIRALLLAGLRSAVLWRQCGGTKLQLFFSRKKMLAAADSLIRGHLH